MAIFDFTDGVMPAGATLARASVGTRIAVPATIVTEGINVARFDYDPNTNQLLGLLIESAATNQWMVSRDLTQNSAGSGGGTITATTFTENASNDLKSILYQSHNAAGQTTISFVANELPGATARRYIMFRNDAAFVGGPVYAVFDLVAGTVSLGGSGSSFVTGTMQSFGGGKWLCALTGNAAANADALFVIMSTPGANDAQPHAGNITTGMAITDLQVEAGPKATSRIITTGVGATRATDILTLDCSPQGLTDGSYSFYVTFDDLSLQVLQIAVVDGKAVVNGNALTRNRVRSIGYNPAVTPAGRTVTLKGTLPSARYAFAQTMDPTDRLDFQLILSQGGDIPFLQAGERVSSFTLALTAQAVAAGLTIRTSTGYVTTLVGNAISFWLNVDPAYVASSVFDGTGVSLDVELTVRTNSTPPRIMQRRISVMLANL